MSLNRVTLIGNLGSDPDIKPSAEGIVCIFSVATNEIYGTQADRKQHTEWHYIVTFGKLAQNCSKYLKKGSRVFLEGRLRTSSYKDKEGRPQMRTKVYPSNVQFLDGKASEDLNSLVLEAMESALPENQMFDSHPDDLA